jgi:hypothetical protein
MLQNRAMKRIAIVALLASACHRHEAGGPGAPCDAIGAKFALVAKAELDADKDLAPDVRDGAKGLVAPMRDGMVRACKDDGWTAASRDCFAAANDERAMKACYAQLTADQRASLDRSAAGSSTDDDSR